MAPLPGFAPLGEVPALPGFGAVDPGLVGPQIVANQAITLQATKDAITAALSSTNPGTRLEGEVGQALVAAGIPVIGFGTEFPDGTGGLVGEIDAETKGAIIKVTMRPDKKLQQIQKLITDPTLNPQMKSVILYAPRYGGFATADIERAGATVVRNLPDLINVITKLGAK